MYHHKLVLHGFIITSYCYIVSSSQANVAGEAPATTPPYVPPTMAPGGSVAPGGGSSNASYCAMDADHTMCQYPVGGAV